MRIAYMNTDEVNEALAEQMAVACGAVVRTVLPKDPAPVGQFDAILYNLDDVPRAERSALLEELRLGRPHSPAAVHGYDLTDEQVRTLGQSGVAAAQRLSADLVRSLCKAARKRRESVPPGACASPGSGQGDLNLQTSVKGFRIRCVSTHGYECFATRPCPAAVPGVSRFERP